MMYVLRTLSRVAIGCFAILFILEEARSYSWYSTVLEWKNLTMEDRMLVENMEYHVRKGRSTVEQLKQKIERYQKISMNYLNNLTRTSTNDISTEFLPFFNEQVSSLLEDQFPFNHKLLRSYQKSIEDFPDTKDLKVAQRTLLNLQKSNNLSTKDLANGYIVETYTGSKLSANGYFGLANLACSEYSLQQCIEWCEEAALHINDTDAAYSINELSDLRHEYNHKNRYSELCQQSINHTVIEHASNPKLKCFLWDNSGHPLLILQPVRAELLSESPIVVLFYKVLSNRQVTYIKNRALTSLGRAQTFEREKHIDIDSHRVAHSSWLNDIMDKSLRKMNKLLEAITGLPTIRSLEPLQIANYGIGGHYRVHLDATDTPAEGKLVKRNRKATFMYYLSDVKYGGATVFVHPGIAVKPVKGAAIFWYNVIWDTGMSDASTLHGGCPVVLGDKWVANKWIWETSHSVCENNKFGSSLNFP